jgi:hypothetical protein
VTRPPALRAEQAVALVGDVLALDGHRPRAGARGHRPARAQRRGQVTRDRLVVGLASPAAGHRGRTSGSSSPAPASTRPGRRHRSRSSGQVISATTSRRCALSATCPTGDGRFEAAGPRRRFLVDQARLRGFLPPLGVAPRRGDARPHGRHGGGRSTARAGGFCQGIAAAGSSWRMAMLHDPVVLVLDEPLHRPRPRRLRRELCNPHRARAGRRGLSRCSSPATCLPRDRAMTDGIVAPDTTARCWPWARCPRIRALLEPVRAAHRLADARAARAARELLQHDGSSRRSSSSSDALIIETDGPRPHVLAVQDLGHASERARVTDRRAARRGPLLRLRLPGGLSGRAMTLDPTRARARAGAGLSVGGAARGRRRPAWPPRSPWRAAAGRAARQAPPGDARARAACRC